MHFKSFGACAVLTLLLSATTLSFAKTPVKQSSTDTKSDTTAKAAKAPLTAYQKFMKTVVDSTRGDFADFYKTKDGKLYMAYPKALLGRRILAGGTVKSVSNPTYVDVGYKYAQPLEFIPEMEDTSLVFKTPNAGITVSTDDPALGKAVDRNYTPFILRRFSIKTWSKDSTKFIFDVTQFVKDLAPKGEMLSPITSGAESAFRFGKVKSFSDNATVEFTQNADINYRILIFLVKLGKVSVNNAVSFLLLPEDTMKPRIRDSRVGVFATSGGNWGKYDFNPERDGLRAYALANRWRIEPTDEQAWKAGQLTTVKKPIVWYLDDSFPTSWRQPIKDGVLAWNEAFEKIGLKDVMQIKDFPTPEEDPEFDPDNLKYSCIRFVPNATMNAMGPSWTDPQTGEILNASVLVYNDVIRLINNWRFVLTSQVDERVRAKKMPQDVLDESMVYVISHEIGHTLGLMHNMGSSSAFPVEKLRDPAFTAEYGTTPSIMDYARFNYVAQPEDKDVRLTPPSLGVYDKYVIEWLYKPIPEAKDMWEESKIAQKLIDEHAGDPLYRYGAQQMASTSYGSYDPSARTEDLGDDPIAASEYGIKNLKYILPDINNWISGDEGYAHRNELYTQAVNQYYRYLGNVLYQVGGIYLGEPKEGTPVAAATPVAKDVQKQSLKWTAKQLKDSEWLNEPSLTANFPLHLDATALVAKSVATALIGDVAGNVVMSSHLLGKDGYTSAEYFDDLYSLFFEDCKGNLSAQEIALQKALVEPIATTVNKALGAKSLTDNSVAEFAGLPSLDDLVSLGIVRPEAAEGALREIENQCGQGAAAYVLNNAGAVGDLCGIGEAKGYFQRKVNTASIDETNAAALQLLTKVNKLAAKRMKSGSEANKAHYRYLWTVSKSVIDR